MTVSEQSVRSKSHHLSHHGWCVCRFRILDQSAKSLFSMVRKGGFEPPRPCGRQPLKLVRLPFRHFRSGSDLVSLTSQHLTARERRPVTS